MNARATSNRMTTWGLPGLLSLLAMLLIDYHDGICAEWKVVTKRYELSEIMYTIQNEGLEKHTGFYFPEYRIDDKVLFSGYRPIEPGEDIEKRSEAVDIRHVWKTGFSKPMPLGETVFFYNRIYVENVDRYSISLHLSKSDVWIEKMLTIPFTGYQLPLNSPLSSWHGKTDQGSTSHDTIDKMLITVYPRGEQYDFVIGDLKIYEMERVDKNYTHPLFRPILTNYTEGALDFEYTPPGVPLVTSSVAWRSLVGHNGDPYYIEPAVSSKATSYNPVDLRELKKTMFRQFIDKYPFYKERGLEKSDLLDRFNSFTTVPISQREAFNDSLIALVSTYGDPHFNASKIGDRRSPMRRSTPPVVFYDILGEIHVAAVFATELKDEVKPGMRLVSVQGQPIEVFISELSERFRGSAYSRRQKAISSILRYLPDSSEIAIGLASVDENGKMVEVRLDTGGDYRIPPNFVPRHGEFRVLDGDIAYFRISRWSLDVWTRFLNHMSDFKKAKGLIIDLRSNPGGEAASVMRVISLFIDEPTLYSREYSPAEDRIEELIVHPNDRYRINRPVAILGNGQTTCGTSLAAIIHRITPSAELIAVRIFHQDLAATEGLLCESLSWCLNNDIDIINLSLGVQTSSPSKELYQLCTDAHERNVVIVSAAHMDLSAESYPAYFPTVFGVTWGKVGSDTEYGFIPDSPIEFIARGTLQRIAWKNGGFTISSGTSLACAYFTGIAAKTMQSFDHASSIDALKTKLEEGATPGITPLQFGGKAYNDNVPMIKSDGVKTDLEGVFKRRFSDWIGNLAVFPASEKEMNAFSDFPEYCISPVVQYFDYPRNLAYASSGKTEPNGDVTRSDRFDRFDTLVTGYFTDQLFESNIKYGSELLIKSLSYGKNVFSYDRRLHAHIEQYRTEQGYKGDVYVPEVTEEHYEGLLPFRYLGSVDVPMLCVLGTSNRQGKFTTQLRIKGILEREGYRIGFLSTEPQGELFGATHSFPYGYRGTVSLDKKKWSFYLRILTRGMQEYLEPHLILTGTQGTSIPRGKSRKLLGNETDTLDYVIGVNPDAFVCAINPQDTIGYIKDTCETFRVYCGAEPLFFVMTPWLREFQKRKNGRTMARHRFLSDEEKYTQMRYFQEEFGKPVFDIMDKTNDGTILELIQGFFSNRP